MSFKNRVNSKIEAAIFEPETTTKKKIDEIKADHMKKMIPVISKYQP